VTTPIKALSSSLLYRHRTKWLLPDVCNLNRSYGVFRQMSLDAVNLPHQINVSSLDGVPELRLRTVQDFCESSAEGHTSQNT
jgi:hypothetical protein